MRVPRLRPGFASRQPAVVRRIFYVFLVLLMGNLGAMVDVVAHPEIPYFDHEHLFTGGITALAMIILLGALDAYLARRNRMEGMLRDSEGGLVGAQAIARIGSYAIDAATGVRTTSKVFNDIVGIGDDDQRDITGWFQLVHEGERQWMVDWFTSAIAGQAGPFDRELRIVRPSDQDVRWVHALGVVEFDAEDRPVTVVGTLQDITERKRAELERQVLHEIAQSVATTANLDDLLALMHRSLQRVFEAENCFVALHDVKTGLFSFPYFVDAHDETPEPVAMPTSCTAYVFRRGEPLLLTPTLSRQLREQNEFVLVGSPSLSWMGVPLRTPSRIIGVLVLQDYARENCYSERDLRFLADVGSQAAIVIERRQAEVELRDREAELNVILESTADGILAVDGMGKVIKTNRRFAELWRLPASVIDSGDDDALLEHVLDQLSDPEAFLAKVRSLYGTADIDRDTLHFKDGRVFERNAAPIIRDGDVVGRVWSFHDITARSLLEAEAAALEVQLRHSQRLESVGLLAGGVAHEFNNMMMVILGNTEFALGEVDSTSPVHAELTAIRKAAQRAAELTGQLLAFARRQRVEPEVLDLNATVNGILTMLQPMIGEDIHVSWTPAAALWPVSMDPSQMEQILTNLVLNARQSIADVGTLSIATSNHVFDAAFCATHSGVFPGDYVRLTVTDTGSGMDAVTLDRVFEPFFTTKDVGKGTGLGLAMVYGAVQQADGFITASSEPGEGSTFDIYLPRYVHAD